MQARTKGLIGLLAAASLAVSSDDTFAQEGVAVAPEDDIFARESETVVPEEETVEPEEDIVTPDQDIFVRPGDVFAQQRGAFALPIGALAQPGDALIGRRDTSGQQGRLSSFTVGAGARYINEDGFDDPQREGFSLVGTLGYNFLSQTSRDTFAFNTGALVPAFSDSDNAGDDFFVENPFTDFNYIRENRTTRLDLFGSFRRSQLGTSNFFADTLDQDIATGEGQRELYTGRVRLEFGRDTPVQGSVGYRYFKSNFVDTDDQTDSETQNLDGRLDFRITPVASVFVFGEWQERDRDREFNPERTSTTVGVGTEYALSPVTDMTLGLTYDKDEDDEETNEGVGGRLRLVRELSNGDVSLNAEGRETINGFRREILIGRFFNMPRGDFRLAAGVVDQDDSDIEPLVNLLWNHQFSETSRFNVNLNQRPGFDDDNNSIIRTRLGVGYEYDVNAVSSLAADFLLVDENRTGDNNAADSTTAIARLSYTRDIGADWGLVSGISYETDQEDFRDDRNTGTIFIGLERTFDSIR